MKLKNNIKLHNFKKNKYNTKYSLNDFLELDMFNPLNQKNYFSQYDLSIFKNKSFRTHVFGMGGSSLSAKLLAQFLDPQLINKSLFIYDNPSPILINSNLSNFKISNKDKFIFISKSGNTIETKYFLHSIINILKQKKIKNIFNKFIFVTENKKNYMKDFAKKNKILTFDHDPNIGGRFSIFSITSLLPLIIMGYSLDKLIKSFLSAKDKFIKNHKILSQNILTSLKYEDINKIKDIVGLSYNSRINSINEWYRQIFAESLGKNISAKNYISAYGSIDQHSQFQLFIDGPCDKHFIFFQIQNKTSTIKNNRQLIDGYNLLSILERGAIKTLQQKKTLVSQITIEEKFDDYSYLLFYLIFDIYLRSKVAQINFLDQPAVEILKKNTRA
jgi:glucose-6-phosphate isomerase